jgi:hypothetical protein
LRPIRNVFLFLRLFFPRPSRKKWETIQFFLFFSFSFLAAEDSGCKTAVAKTAVDAMRDRGLSLYMCVCLVVCSRAGSAPAEDVDARTNWVHARATHPHRPPRCQQLLLRGGGAVEAAAVAEMPGAGGLKGEARRLLAALAARAAAEERGAASVVFSKAEILAVADTIELAVPDVTVLLERLNDAGELLMSGKHYKLAPGAGGGAAAGIKRGWSK